MPRPPRITAAAVLLIALGGQFVVAFAGYAFLALYGRKTGLLDRLILPEGCWFCGTPILAILGADFLRVGIGILSASRLEIFQASFRIAGFGALAAVLCLVGVCFVMVPNRSSDEIQRLPLLESLPVFIPIAFDSFAILVAGILLRKYSEKYLEWRKAYISAPNAFGYEDEED